MRPDTEYSGFVVFQGAMLYVIPPHCVLDIQKVFSTLGVCKVGAPFSLVGRAVPCAEAPGPGCPLLHIFSCSINKSQFKAKEYFLKKGQCKVTSDGTKVCVVLTRL